MPNDPELETALHELVIDICEVLYCRGIDRVCIGALMRLVGIDNAIAQPNDNEYLNLDSTFQEIIQKRKQPVPAAPPSGAVLH